MTLRELKYVLIGDDRLSAKLKNVAGAGKSASDSLRHSSDRLAKFKRNMSEAADEIPGVSTGLRMLRNPLFMTTTALVAIGAGFKRATDEAQQFNTTFRELANLNMDKSPAQLNALRNMVLNSAYEKGFDPNKTSRAYYDIQSVTGLFGGQVAKIVEQQGEFANLMQADFNAWIEGTGKAIANYRFGADALDAFNRSAYATVKVGSITFDQLAKVQSAYAGAAASAGQSFDAANKMLTVFTVKTKSADEAATLTKSLFNDLTKKATIDSLKKVGINLFDANGKIKQADTLMVELNRKFQQLGGSGTKIAELKNQFTGSEGLIAFVQAATDSSGGLMKTLNDFDETKLGLNKALELAKKDINYINAQLENRTKTALIQVGQDFLPIKAALTEFASGSLSGLRNIFGGKTYGNTQGASDALKEFDFLMYDAAKLSPEDFDKGMKSLMDNVSVFQDLAEKYRGDKNNFFNPQGKYNYAYASGFLSTLFDIQRQANENRAKGIVIPRPNQDSSATGTQSPDPFSKGIESIAGGGNQVRNITVNITKLIENQNINTTTITEANQQIKQLTEEALIRAINGTEQMLAS